jgi:hypothetical protein
VLGVREEQGVLRQLTSSKGSKSMVISHHEQGTAFPSKDIFFLLLFSFFNKSAPARDW